MRKQAGKGLHAVLTDLDDTLTSRGSTAHETILKTLHDVGYTHVTLEEISAINNLTHVHEIYGIDMRTFWDQFNCNDDRARHLREGHITLHQDAILFLTRLKESDIPVYIVTNTPPRKAEATVEHLRLYPHIDGMVAYNYDDPRDKPKPHPDIAYTALKRMGLLDHNGHGTNGDRPHLWIVGDEEGDVKLAYNLKADFVTKGIEVVVHSIHVHRRGDSLPADYTTRGEHHLLFAANIIEYHGLCPTHRTHQEQP